MHGYPDIGFPGGCQSITIDVETRVEDLYLEAENQIKILSIMKLYFPAAAADFKFVTSAHPAFFVLLMTAIISHAPQARGQETASDDDSIRIALFTDPHFTEGRLKQTTPRMPILAQDANHRIPDIDFVMGLGDEVHDNAAWIGVWKRELQSQLNLPYLFSLGDHDVVDYYWKDEPKSEFPYKVLTGFMRESELTTPSYAMLRSNILFLIIGDKGPILKIHESQKRWIEHMVGQYPDKTTVLVSHAAIRGTTAASGRHWGFRHSEMWWWELFHNNPQIMAYLHGDGHALSYYAGSINNQQGYEGTNGDWGHDIAFIEPGGHSLLRDKHSRDQFIVLDIDKKGLTTRAWRNEDTGGWVDVYDHEFSFAGGTTYDPDAIDWYSFPLFFQDGETQILDNDLVPFGPVQIQLCGVAPYSLFNNAEIYAGHPKNKQVSGFEDEPVKAFLPDEDAFTVDGPNRVGFPDKRSGNEKGGKSGQIKNYLLHGSTPQVIPGAKYEITVVSKCKSGTGQLAVEMSTSDWSTGTQYSTLTGSEQTILSGTIGTEFTTLRGTYTAPENNDAWFLQGDLVFSGETEYTVDAFRIFRKSEDPLTKAFSVSLNDQTYFAAGVLQPGQAKNFKVASESITNNRGQLHFQASIGGNHQGMARLIFQAPFLMGRNGRFRIDEVEGNAAQITLIEPVSQFTNQFKLLPFARGAETFSVNPGELHQSDSGRRHAELTIPDHEVKARIIYGR